MWRNDESRLRLALALCRALADESRIRIVQALVPGEVCVCQLVELLDLAPSTVSKHLAVLRDAGLIAARKDGRWMHYRLAGDEAPPIVRGCLQWVRESLAHDPNIGRDAERLKEILAIEPRVLCCRQRGGQDPAADGDACCPPGDEEAGPSQFTARRDRREDEERAHEREDTASRSRG